MTVFSHFSSILSLFDATHITMNVLHSMPDVHRSKPWLARRKISECILYHHSNQQTWMASFIDFSIEIVNKTHIACCLCLHYHGSCRCCVWLQCNVSTAARCTFECHNWATCLPVSGCNAPFGFFPVCNTHFYVCSHNITATITTTTITWTSLTNKQTNQITYHT